MSEYREPSIGEDVYATGMSPQWHAHYYQRTDEYRWQYTHANGIIIDIEYGDDDDVDGEVFVLLDTGETITIDLPDFHDYRHPLEGGMGMWWIY